MNIGYLIQLSAKLLKANLQKRLEQEKITVSQWAVIKDIQMQQQLSAPKTNFTAVSIAERLDMDKPTISGIIHRLTEKGYVVKKQHPTDKRAQVIELTEVCEILIPTLEALSEETIEEALQHFNDLEKKQLTTYLQTVVKNLRGEQ